LAVSVDPGDVGVQKIEDEDNYKDDLVSLDSLVLNPRGSKKSKIGFCANYLTCPLLGAQPLILLIG
jgi:hypothetical protein